MNLLSLQRHEFTDISTIGDLHLDGVFQGNVLEDTCRAAGIKVYGKTAIPAGRYRVIIAHSTRFKRRMPRLLGVPGWPNDDILIHPGNTEKQTLGCLLTGLYDSKHPNFIYESVLTFDRFFSKLDALPGPFEILVRGGRSISLAAA